MKRIALLAPMTFFFSFFAVALVLMVRISLQDIRPGEIEFVGLRNFIAIFNDPDFLQHMANTFIYVVLIAIGQTFTALLIALGLRHFPRRVRAVSMFFLYLPAFSGGVIIASVWRWVFAAKDGLLNSILGTDVVWLLHRVTAIPAISLVLVVTNFGFPVIVFSVALAAVSKEITDAARIDGATNRQIAWRVLVPIIRQMIATMGLLSGIGAFLLWNLIHTLVPAMSAHNLMYDIYRTAFSLGHYGEGAAKTMVLMALIILFAVVKRRVER